MLSGKKGFILSKNLIILAVIAVVAVFVAVNIMSSNVQIKQETVVKDIVVDPVKLKGDDF